MASPVIHHPQVLPDHLLARIIASTPGHDEDLIPSIARHGLIHAVRSSDGRSVGHLCADAKSWIDLERWYDHGGSPMAVDAQGLGIDTAISTWITSIEDDLRDGMMRDASDFDGYGQTSSHAWDDDMLGHDPLGNGRYEALDAEHTGAIEAYRSWVRAGGDPWLLPSSVPPRMGWHPCHDAFNRMGSHAAATPAEKMASNTYGIFLNGMDFMNRLPDVKHLIQDPKAHAMGLSFSRVLADHDPILMASWMQRLS
jgi:hypothetical protein